MYVPKCVNFVEISLSFVEIGVSFVKIGISFAENRCLTKLSENQYIFLEVVDITGKIFSILFSNQIIPRTLPYQDWKLACTMYTPAWLCLTFQERHWSLD